MGTRKVLVILGLAGFWVFSLLAVAGDLEPSGAPAPTMKPLDEVEPRIAIGASDLPLVITGPNSYYLTEDIHFTSTVNHAITVECNDVTIDLMGYTLKGPDSGTKSGVYMNGRSNVEIRNGTIRNFGYPAIYESATNGNSHRVINIHALSNGYGIALSGSGHLVKDCAVSVNSNSGISAGYDSTVTDNNCNGNGGNGIGVSSCCLVTGNTCNDNGGRGINAGYGNTVTGNMCYNNSAHGIDADSGSTVTGNTCNGNDNDGIQAAPASTVIGNTARDNTSYGIYAPSYCLVDQNTTYGNGTNMYTGTGCVLGTNCAP